MHVTDWLPTLLAATGRRDLVPTDLDGINQWDYLIGASASPPRTLMLYNADTTTGQAALRWGDWKLLLNESTFVGWFSGSGTNWGIEYCSNMPTETVQLFNVTGDEQERVDLSQQQPEVVSEMRAVIDEYIRCDNIFQCGAAVKKIAGVHLFDNLMLFLMHFFSISGAFPIAFCDMNDEAAAELWSSRNEVNGV